MIVIVLLLFLTVAEFWSAVCDCVVFSDAAGEKFKSFFGMTRRMCIAIVLEFDTDADIFLQNKIAPIILAYNGSYQIQLFRDSRVCCDSGNHSIKSFFFSAFDPNIVENQTRPQNTDYYM